MTATTVGVPGQRPAAVDTSTLTQLPPAGRYALAVLRLATGFIFLWAFLDKTFGLGVSTRRSGRGSTGARRARAF